MKKITTILPFLLFACIAFSQGKEKRKMRIVENENGKKIEMELENDQVTVLKIDDKVVPKEKFTTYKEMTDRLQKGMMQENSLQDKMQKQMLKNEMLEQSIKTKKEGENMTLTISGNENEPIKFVITKDGKIQYNGETLNDGSEVKLKSVKKMMLTDDEKGEEIEKNERIIIKKSEDSKGSQKEIKKIMVMKDGVDTDKMTKEMTSEDEWLDDELLKDKLISNKDNVDFEINGTTLLIDGKKQSNTVFEKYKQLFEKRGVKFNEKTKVVIKKIEKK